MIKYNQDSIYFKITSPSIKSEINEKDFLSLSITEEQGKLTTGTLSLLDPGGAYFSILRRGVIMVIEWGYISIINAPIKKGLSVMVMSPGHDMSDNGVGITSINFQSGFTLIRDKKKQLYNGTKKNAVLQVMTAAGVVEPIVDFTGSNEKGAWRQDSETDFQFLRRLSVEWKKQFIVGYTQSGKLSAVFIDYNSRKAEEYLSKLTGQLLTQNLYEYGAGIRNVISASIEQNFAESGGGELVQFVLIDGQAVKQSVETRQQTVQYLKFDSEKLLREQKEIADKKGFAAAQQWTQDIINSRDFQDENIRRFWSPVDYKTAAPHTGMKITITAIGNPLLTVPSPVTLGSGFPSAVVNATGPSGTGYQIRRLTHSISSQGYTNEIEIRNYINL